MLKETQPADAHNILTTDYRALDARVVKLWRINSLISLTILFGVALPVLYLLEARVPGLWPRALPVWVALALLSAVLGYSLPSRAYRAWSWRIDAKVLETRSGLFVKVARLLPLTRVQHVDLERGPFERLFGLASLVLYTAGTHDSSITIPGLDAEEATRLRDLLVEIGGDDAV